jgi:hypothetical protein
MNFHSQTKSIEVMPDIWIEKDDLWIIGDMGDNHFYMILKESDSIFVGMMIFVKGKTFQSVVSATCNSTILGQSARILFEESDGYVL